MAQTKNLCAQIPLDLHTKVCEALEESAALQPQEEDYDESVEDKTA